MKRPESILIIVVTILLLGTVEGVKIFPPNGELKIQKEMMTKQQQQKSPMSTIGQQDDDVEMNTYPISIVFSDVDGTLVHYPSSHNANIVEEENNDDDSNTMRNDITKRKMITLPKSATGSQGILSVRTITLCQQIRSCYTRRHDTSSSSSSTTNINNDHVKFILISGMRTSTLFKRLPYLPRADAYCCESGGRIFYPIPMNDNDDDNNDNLPASHNIIHPLVHPEDDNSKSQSFQLVEDMEWRKYMESYTGTDGYNENTIPIKQRTNSIVWDYANQLIQCGYQLDYNDYSTCFRIHKKQQTSLEKFDHLLHHLMNRNQNQQQIIKNIINENDSELQHDNNNNDIPLPSFHLTTSTNLGCIDVYPSISGKNNCCEYLAKKFLNNDDNQKSHSDDDATATSNRIQHPTLSSLLLSTQCLCICDDDNDIEMALACYHAYIPCITSNTMAQTIKEHSNHFTVTIPSSQTNNDNDNVDYTISTEMALHLVLQRIKKHNSNNPSS